MVPIGDRAGVAAPCSRYGARGAAGASRCGSQSVAGRDGVGAVEGLTWRMISAMTRPRPSPIGMTRARSNFDGLTCSR